MRGGAATLALYPHKFAVWLYVRVARVVGFQVPFTMIAIGEVVLGDDMIWWGYAGFSGAIVASMGLIATIMGVSTEAVLSLVARSGIALLALGLVVHLIAIVMRSGPPKRRPVVTPVAVARAASTSAALLAPKPAVAVAPTAGSPAMLWPMQKAAH